MFQQLDSLMEMIEVFSDEQVCIDHLRSIRWKNGAFCPHCGGTKVYNFSDKRTHKCGDCRQRFSIKVGTIFEDTKLPLTKWFMAICLMTSHKNGIASTQLAKALKITQKTSWFVLHRLRHAARTKSFNAPLDGDVEVDENCVGGKSKNKRDGRVGTPGKTAFVGALEPGGDVAAQVVPNTDATLLREFVKTNVAKTAKSVSTEELTACRELGKAFNHSVVQHSIKQYRNGDFYTNSIEGHWSLVKRHIIGIRHWVGRKHLIRCCTESAWRYNRRCSNEGNIVNLLLESVSGRLGYKALIA